MWATRNRRKKIPVTAMTAFLPIDVRYTRSSREPSPGWAEVTTRGTGRASGRFGAGGAVGAAMFRTVGPGPAGSPIYESIGFHSLKLYTVQIQQLRYFLAVAEVRHFT